MIDNRMDIKASPGGEMGFAGRNLLKAFERMTSSVMTAAVISSVVLASQQVYAATAENASSYFVYVAGSGRPSKGIYQYRLDEKTGAMTAMGVAAEMRGASWLTTDAGHHYLYAIGAPSNAANQADLRGSAISSYSIDPKTGALKYLNSVGSGGKGPAHISLDKTGKILFAANYGSGSVSSFAIKADGSIGDMTSMDQHSGTSVNPMRQKGPHPHSVVVSPDNKYVISPDLGLDKIFIYKIDTAKQTITPNSPAYVDVKPGLGPRHFTFGKSGKFAYVLCEMGASVVTLTYDAAKGTLAPVQSSSILPPNPTPEDQGSEIEMAPSGQYLYASNQGPEGNSAQADGYVTAFQIDQKTGMAKQIQVQPTGGKEVRSFAIDPAGKYLLAGNGVSNTVVEFAIGTDGKLTATKQTLDVGSPASVLFVPAP